MELIDLNKEFVLPPALEKGDKVAIVATSSGVQRFPSVLDKGVQRLEERFDLETEIFPTAEKSTEYLNSNPEQKAEEFMQAFEDPEIKAVVALTGGDEQLRILKHLEPQRLKENPTRFYGLSDNTNLHIYLWSLGIRSFYGGQILDDLLAEEQIGEYTYSYLEKAFFQDKIGELRPSDRFTDKFFDLSRDEVTDDRERFESPEWEFWNFDDESVEGRLFGGCFEVLSWQLAAGRYLPDPEELEDRILFLETSEEAPPATSVKRWLMCMGERGLLQKFSAVLVGRPIRAQLHGEERTEEEKQEYHRTQKQAIKNEVERYCPETPIVFDMDFGHTHPKITLPVGGKIRIDPEEKTIKEL
ncbi:S66 family peptidase [Candidatus Nanosalina sp. VS9-1]|uniref:S66 family peptidase n=1 Tax=Candidatus Nanosalina sp. VS9-1 TaxID=3388566 RepID=UPI0039DFF25F